MRVEAVKALLLRLRPSVVADGCKDWQQRYAVPSSAQVLGTRVNQSAGRVREDRPKLDMHGMCVRQLSPVHLCAQQRIAGRSCNWLLWRA